MKRHKYCGTCIANNDCPHQRLDEAEYCEVYKEGEYYQSHTVVQQSLSGSDDKSSSTQICDDFEEGEQCTKGLTCKCGECEYKSDADF